MAEQLHSPSWTVRGVSSDVKKIARDAARRENLSLAVWLERAVHHAAEYGTRHSDKPEPPNPRPHRRYF